MGYFTWTLANRKQEKDRHGDYKRSCLLKYDGYGAIVCPDDTVIAEDCYEGYGIFDGKDVYDLAADWNRPYISKIMADHRFKRHYCGMQEDLYDKMLLAFERGNQKELDEAIRDISASSPYMARDWKRNIGIFLACSQNHLLPFPIKIVDLKRDIPKYADLPPSDSTQ